MKNNAFNTAILERVKRISIIDPCPYGQRGWHCLFQSTNPRDIFVGSNMHHLLTNDAWIGHSHARHLPSHYLILRLPSHAQQAILMLLQLSDFTSVLLRFQCLVVITPFTQNVTRHIFTGCSFQCATHIITGRHSLHDLCHYISLLSRQTIRPHSYPKRDLSEAKGGVLALTPAERKVLQQTLSEIPVRRQVRLNNSLAKTIYSQRRSALLKLGARNVLGILRILMLNKYNGYE
ncbi:hypothetical protein I5M74_22480 [Serratia marcescens]|nr:hypothetical protein [Serratia marcescens]